MCQENRLWKKISKKTWHVKEKIPLNWRSYNILKHQLQKTTEGKNTLHHLYYLYAITLTFLMLI